MRENLENIKSEGGWGLMGEELTKLKLFKQISRRVRSGYVGGRWIQVIRKWEKSLPGGVDRGGKRSTGCLKENKW